MKYISLKPVLDILLPARCLLCAQESVLASLCEACSSLCHKCPMGGFVFDKNQPGALFFYEFAVREIIQHAKFHRSLAHARLLFDLVQQNLARPDFMNCIKEYAPTAIGYVPTHWMRRAVRGLDLPSMFAHLLSKEFKLPLVHALEKTKIVEPQSSLQHKTDRLKAVLGLFALKKNFKPCKRLLLVDDIITTGATFSAATRVLKNSCQQIRSLAIAKTP